MRLFLAALVAAFLVAGPALADEARIGPVRIIQGLTARYPGVHVRAVLHDAGAQPFIAALNAEPPVSRDVGDEVIVLERAPTEGAAVFVLLKGCAVASFAMPRDWVEQHLSSGA